MKLLQRKALVSVTIADSISFDALDASFLRVMAQHCIDTKMPGWNACELLIKILDAANVPEYHGGPVYDVFEER